MPRFRPAKAESGQSMSTLGLVGQNARTRPKVSHTLYASFCPVEANEACYRMNFAILRIEKHRTRARLAGALNHAFRERPTPNADPARLHMNTIFGANSTAHSLAAVDERVSLASDSSSTTKSVICVEYMISATPLAMEVKSRAQQDAYLHDAINWIRQKHGAENVVSALIHRDEGTNPHVSAFVVPLVHTPAGTRKRSVIAGTNPDGSKRRETREYPKPSVVRLSATHYFPDPGALSEMQTDFAVRVGAPHGLMRGIKGSKRHHERVARGYAIEAAADLEPAVVPTLPVRTRFSRSLDDDRARDQEMIDREFRALEKQRNDLAQQLAVAQRTAAQHAGDAMSLMRERDQIRREREAIQAERQGLIERATQAEASASDWRAWAIGLLKQIYRRETIDAAREFIRGAFKSMGIDYPSSGPAPGPKGRGNLGGPSMG